MRAVFETLLSIRAAGGCRAAKIDRKSTRLNSSHGYISYAVFCLKIEDLRAGEDPVVVVAVRTRLPRAPRGALLAAEAGIVAQGRATPLVGVDVVAALLRLVGAR